MAEKLSKLYSVRQAILDADRHQILRLWSLISSSAAPDSQKLDWFYVQNPAGQGVIHLLWHEPTNTPVGITCAGRRDILIGQSIVRGAVCGDLVIDPAHRSLGPSLLLQKFVMKQLMEDFDLVYAFPNERAATAMPVRGLAIERELLDMVLPLRVSHYLPRFMPKPLARFVRAPAQLVLDLLLKARASGVKGTYQQTNADDLFLDTLWSGIAAGHAAMGIRDSQFLKWRLQQHPSAEFFIFAVTLNDGSPAGYIVYKVNKDHSVKIIDILSRDETVFEESMRMLIGKMREGGFQSVSMRQPVEPATRLHFLKKIGFVVSTRSKVFIYGNDRVLGNLRKSELYLNTIDSDV